ncbi:MAG: peptidase M3, partial [Actinobacteria bacterium]|nr:peptidase M3 [Actinomycetota bacterium]
MTDATPLLEPITLPSSDEGWLAFVTERADEHLDRAEAIIAELKSDPSTDALVLLRRFDEAEFALAGALHAAELISESHPLEAVREAAEARIERGSAIITGISIDRELWRVFDAADAAGLDEQASRRYDDLMRDFRRGGVALDDAQRERVRVLHERDTELGLAFSRNIRDGRREIRVARHRLAGLPQDFIDAHPADAEGLVTLTTEYPDLMPVRDYAQDRALREELTAAYNDLAWPENDAVLAELLEVRQELSTLLGFTDWADYETETRMIGRGAAIPEFLARVADAARDAGAAEYQQLLERLRRDHPEADSVTTADFPYLLGTLKREEYAVDSQQVRSYFPFERVLEGVLQVTGRLLELEYRPVEVPSWHADVRAYDVHRAGRDGTGSGERIGRFYLDLHPREGKYNHAACFGLAPGVAGRALPEGALLCNFARGLMEHDEVETFFHEFGHLVHGILGGHQGWVRFSGIET